MSVENERRYLESFVKFLIIISLLFIMFRFGHFHSIRALLKNGENYKFESGFILKVMDMLAEKRTAAGRVLFLVGNMKADYSHLIYRTRYLMYPERIDFALLLDDGSYRLETFDYRNGIECFKAPAFCDRSYGAGRTISDWESEYDVLILIQNDKLIFLKNI